MECCCKHMRLSKGIPFIELKVKLNTEQNKKSNVFEAELVRSWDPEGPPKASSFGNISR